MAITQVWGKPHTLAEELQSPAIQVKNQCWGRKALAEQLRQIWADTKPWVTSSHQQKLSVAALLSVITMLWTLYTDPCIYSSLRRNEELPLVWSIREAEKNFSPRNIDVRFREILLEKNQKEGTWKESLGGNCVSAKWPKFSTLFLLHICEDACSQPSWYLPLLFT